MSVAQTVHAFSMWHVHHEGVMLKVRAGERAGSEQTKRVQRSKSCGAACKKIKGLLTAKSWDMEGAKGSKLLHVRLHWSCKRKFQTILIGLRGDRLMFGWLFLELFAT